MILDDLFPLTAMTAPPANDAEAEQRAAAVAADVMLTKLVEVVFHDAGQFRRAMNSARYNVEMTPLRGNNARIRHFQGHLTGQDGGASEGWRFWFLLEEVAGQCATVRNCVVARWGKGVDPATRKAYKELVEEEDEPCSGSQGA